MKIIALALALALPLAAAQEQAAELAAGEDFSSQMDELVGLKQEGGTENIEDGERTKNYILRTGMRGRWGGDDSDSEEDAANDDGDVQSLNPDPGPSHRTQG